VGVPPGNMRASASRSRTSARDRRSLRDSWRASWRACTRRSVRARVGFFAIPEIPNRPYSRDGPGCYAQRTMRAVRFKQVDGEDVVIGGAAITVIEGVIRLD
jgi:hypothetical protein